MPISEHSRYKISCYHCHHSMADEYDSLSAALRAAENAGWLLMDHDGHHAFCAQCIHEYYDTLSIPSDVLLQWAIRTNNPGVLIDWMTALDIETQPCFSTNPTAEEIYQLLAKQYHPDFKEQNE